MVEKSFAKKEREIEKRLQRTLKTQKVKNSWTRN